MQDTELRKAMPDMAEWVDRAIAHGTIYYLVESVSRSGMMRSITLYTIGTDRDGKPELKVAWPDYEASEKARREIMWSRKHRCFRVGGCGMDMVFHLLYELGSMFGVGDKLANHVRRESLSRAD
jgi:hypothetical protein